MTLPLVLSVPHAGTAIPPEVADLNMLSDAEIAADGDEGAAEVYLPLASEVTTLVSTPVARAFVDQNRAEDDRRKDGVVKTHTCWDVPIYREALAEPLVEQLLSGYHRPYHQRLAEAARGRVRAGVDCHTMAAIAPPVAPDPGAVRPMVCLGDGNGAACPEQWSRVLLECLAAEFGGDARLNEPFSGGYICRSHATELPWVQLELSRTHAVSNDDKRARVRAALNAWCDHLGWL